MSGGRVELGLGAGWYDAEHTAYGIPFPALGERFERLEEQLAIVTGCGPPPRGDVLLRGDHYGVATARPCPSRCSGPGRRSSSAAADRGARPAWPPPTPSEFNLAFRSLTDTADQFERVRGGV